MATRGRISNVPISRIVRNTFANIYAKFGAFITNGNDLRLNRPTIYKDSGAQLLTALEPFLVWSLLLDQFAMGDPTGARGSRQHSSWDSWGHSNLSTTLR